MVALVALNASLLLAATEEGKTSGSEQVVFSYDSKGRRDPFVALVEEGRAVGSRSGVDESKSSKPVLYGVLWDPNGQSIALIDNTEVKVGDQVGLYEVKEIRKDTVVLSSEAESLVLQIAFDSPASGKQGQEITQ